MSEKNKDAQVYSIDAVAHLCGLTFNRLDFLIRKGKVPVPHCVVGVKSRFYTAADLTAVRGALKKLIEAPMLTEAAAHV